MDTILSYFQSLAVANDTQHALFLLIAGATAFLFALGIAFLVLAAVDPVRRTPSMRLLSNSRRAASLRPASCSLSSRSIGT
jgi:hypothetical protein